MIAMGFAVTVLIGTGLSADRPPPDRDPAMAAADARQKRFEAFRLEYEYVETVASGALSGGPLIQMPGPIPVRELTLNSTNRIILGGNRYRIENNHPKLYVHHGVYKARWHRMYFNGELGKLHYQDTDDPDAAGIGIIENANPPFATWESSLVPLIAFFRGNDQMSPYPLANFRATGARQRIDNVDCVEYRFAPRPDSARILWLAPTRDYVPVRFETEPKAHPDSRTDVRYRQDDLHGWVPDSWTGASYASDGTRTHSITGKITNLDVDGTIPESEFDIDFPPGTFVYDQRTDEEYRVPLDGTAEDPTTGASEEDRPVAGGPDGTPVQPAIWPIVLAILVIVAVAIALIRRLRSQGA